MANRERVPIELVQVGDLVETGSGPKRVKRVMSRKYSGNGVRLVLKGKSEDLVA
ncbi:MAG: hypothetical protein GWN86_03015, partial [Desulfobacterales bacterium]|nr:hypothetical protein [Desulfobacterales bacterium]